MKTIGLIGGMSFESTAVYYRMINEAVRERLGGLHSADVLVHSVDFQSIVDLQKAGRWDAAGERLGTVAAGLEKAGAQCVLICTNTMHLVADAVQDAVSAPVINIIDEVALNLRPEATHAVAGAAALAASESMSVDAAEEKLVREALERTGGNIQRAAGLLGLSRPSLYRRMEKYGIE